MDKYDINYVVGKSGYFKENDFEVTNFELCNMELYFVILEKSTGKFYCLVTTNRILLDEIETVRFFEV